MLLAGFVLLSLKRFVRRMKIMNLFWYRYCEEMLEFSLRQTSISGFHFQKELTENHGSASSQKKSLLRLTQEISGLATSLPISFASSVFLVTDEARMDILRFLTLHINSPASTFIPCRNILCNSFAFMGKIVSSWLYMDFLPEDQISSLECACVEILNVKFWEAYKARKTSFRIFKHFISTRWIWLCAENLLWAILPGLW